MEEIGDTEDILGAALSQSGLNELHLMGEEEPPQPEPQPQSFQIQTVALPSAQSVPVCPDPPREFITVQAGMAGQHAAQIIGTTAMSQAPLVERPKKIIKVPAGAGGVQIIQGLGTSGSRIITTQPANGRTFIIRNKGGSETVLHATATKKPVLPSNGQPSSSTVSCVNSPVVVGNVTPSPGQVTKRVITFQGSPLVVQQKPQMPLSTRNALLGSHTIRVGTPGSRPSMVHPLHLDALPRTVGGAVATVPTAEHRAVVPRTVSASQLSLLKTSTAAPQVIIKPSRPAGGKVQTVTTSPFLGRSVGGTTLSTAAPARWEGPPSHRSSPVHALNNIPTVVAQTADLKNSATASSSNPRDVDWSPNAMAMRAFMHSPPSREEELAEAVEEESEELGHAETYADYKPRKVLLGQRHPDQVVESSSLASVAPPDVTHVLAIPEEVMDTGALSSLQLEAITYASQRHSLILPSGERAGYFIGDGAGVGKGRTVAGIIQENYLMGRKKALWLSVSNDLKVDAERDLRDIGASSIKVYSLNKFKYAKISSAENGSVKKGVLFFTYSSLIGESSQSQSKYRTRLKQIVKFFGKSYDGPIIFDECHKAKNLCPTGSSKPTKTGSAVLELQNQLPNARVVYASATGATEPRNMAYMTRLGLWGKDCPFKEFNDFINCVEKRGVGAMELVAMEMKLRGTYIARQLSFRGVSFKIVDSPMDKMFQKMYDASTRVWMDTRFGFQYCADLLGVDSRTRKVMWAQFWATQQRFFKHMCIASKVHHCVQLVDEAIDSGKCVVIGLQSTGEARTQELVDQEGDMMDDFLSTAKGVLQNLVEKHFPAVDRSKTLEFLGLGLYDRRQGLKRKNDDLFGPSKRARLDEDSVDDEDDDDDDDDVSKSSSESVDSDSSSMFDSESDEESNPFANGYGSDDETPWVKKAKKKKAKAPKPKKPEKKKKKKSCVDKEDEYCDRTLAKMANMRKTSSLASLGNSSTNDNADMERKMQAALQMKTDLLAQIEALKLPHNTLDSLIDKLGGPEYVAEMTGRKGRVVQNVDGIQYESRSEMDVSMEYLNLKEKERFMDGEKNIAIISEAASSGISLHADRRAENQKRRVHITLELPWSADRAIQQFGRTHRSNQVSAPEYMFLISDLAGERRFASTVAKRLESLGALTHGDRRATESRDLSRFNIDNRFGRQALEIMMKSVLSMCEPIVDMPKEYTKEQFCSEVKDALEGVGLITVDPNTKAASLEKDYNNISKFLNRLLGMPVDLQNALFEYFDSTLTKVIKDAKRCGRWDMGILDLGSGQDVVKKLETQVFIVKTATNHSARTELHKIQVERGMSWENAMNIWRKCKGTEEGFYLSLNGRSKHTAALVVAQGTNKKKERVYSLYRPNSGLQTRADTMEDIRKKFKKVMPDVAETPWKDQYELSATHCIHAFWNGRCKKVSEGLSCDLGLRTRQYFVLSGSVLSVWTSVESVLSSMPGGNVSKLQVVRLKTGVDGEKIVGSLIPSSCVGPLANVLRKDSAQTYVENHTVQAAVNSITSHALPSTSFSTNAQVHRSESSMDSNGDCSQPAASVSAPPPAAPAAPVLSMPIFID